MTLRDVLIRQAEYWESCGYGDEVASVEWVLAAIDSATEQLTKLERWDMLTVDDEAHGIATADAPWARACIAAALANLNAPEVDE